MTNPAALLALGEEIVHCRACQDAGLLPQVHPIRPAAPPQPRIILIGQSPGTITDRLGYHFAGPSGRVIESWLVQAGFAPEYFRGRVYLTSLTRCFPGKSPVGHGDRPPSRAEMALCRPFLERELDLLRPRLVVLVGKMAIDAFLGVRPLAETVGTVAEREGRLFLPLPHASGVSRWLNAPENRARVDQALAQLSRLRVELDLEGIAPG